MTLINDTKLERYNTHDLLFYLIEIRSKSYMMVNYDNSKVFILDKSKMN